MCVENTTTAPSFQIPHRAKRRRTLDYRICSPAGRLLRRSPTVDCEMLICPLFSIFWVPWIHMYICMVLLYIILKLSGPVPLPPTVHTYIHCMYVHTYSIMYIPLYIHTYPRTTRILHIFPLSSTRLGDPADHS